jgi:hypothetical protein
MILSQELLKEVKYYTETERHYFGIQTIFTLHFRKWWKPRKKIVMQWSLHDSKGYISTYRETDNICKLRHQLETYFGAK